jgi:hypothetical protein
VVVVVGGSVVVGTVDVVLVDSGTVVEVDVVSAATGSSGSDPNLVMAKPSSTPPITAMPAMAATTMSTVEEPLFDGTAVDATARPHARHSSSSTPTGEPQFEQN